MNHLIDNLVRYIDNLKLIDSSVSLGNEDILSNTKSTSLYLMTPSVRQKYNLSGINAYIERRNSHIPNSISRIEDKLLNVYQALYWGLVKVKEDSYAINSFSIFRYNKFVLDPCMILVADSKIVEKIMEFELDSSKAFLEKDYASGKEKIKNLSLIISKKFIESDSGKSLYNRLNKNFLPSLLENNVEIRIVSEDYILKNVFNPFQRKFTPLEQRSFEKMVIQEVEKRLLEEVQVSF